MCRCGWGEVNYRLVLWGKRAHVTGETHGLGQSIYFFSIEDDMSVFIERVGLDLLFLVQGLPSSYWRR